MSRRRKKKKAQGAQMCYLFTRGLGFFLLLASLVLSKGSAANTHGEREKGGGGLRRLGTREWVEAVLQSLSVTQEESEGL